MRSTPLTGLAALACALATPLAAHVVIEPRQAPPASYRKLLFLVGHGCHGAPTEAVRIEIPESVTVARPQPKAGWTLTIETAPLATPLTDAHGHRVTERVAAVTWSGGPLPADQFDEFGLLVRTPEAAAGPVLSFPTLQRCTGTEVRWDGLPAEGQNPFDLPHPAPRLILEEV